MNLPGRGIGSNMSGGRKAAIIVSSVVVWFAGLVVLGHFSHPSAEHPIAVNAATESVIQRAPYISTEVQVARQMEEQYRFIFRSHGKMIDLCAQAGVVKAAQLQARSQAEYQRWEQIRFWSCRDSSLLYGLYDVDNLIHDQGKKSDTYLLLSVGVDL